MKRRTKIIFVFVMLSTLCVCFAVPTFAYGGTEIRTDIASSVITQRINTPRVAIGWEDEPPETIIPTPGGAGHFIDNGVAWHNNRDYYGNGSIAVTNYRDNPDTTYNLPYLYNYYSSGKYDELRYTLPFAYNWARVHFDVYYATEHSVREYISLGGNTRSTTVYYNYDVIEYNSNTNQTERKHISESFLANDSFIPFMPPSIQPGDTCYDLTITTWSASYTEVTIGTIFDTDEAINALTLSTSNELFEAYKQDYNPAPTFTAFWGALWGSLDSFLAIEVFPGFTLGTIVYILFAFTALGILLKYFAGG